MTDAGDIGPVKAPLRVRLADHVLADLSPAQREDAAAFMGVLERRLWVWERFPVRLPPTAFGAGSSGLVNVQDLFRAPASDEVRELGTSDGGRGPRLSAGQLAQLRESATFSVPSRRYPGLSHVWQVGPALQRGQAAIREGWRARLAAAAGQLLRVPDRLWRDGAFSVVRALRGARKALEGVPGLLIGMREEHPAHPPAEIEGEAEELRLKSLREVSLTGTGPSASSAPPKPRVPAADARLALAPSTLAFLSGL